LPQRKMVTAIQVAPTKVIKCPSVPRPAMSMTNPMSKISTATRGTACDRQSENRVASSPPKPSTKEEQHDSDTRRRGGDVIDRIGDLCWRKDTLCDEVVRENLPALQHRQTHESRTQSNPRDPCEPRGALASERDVDSRRCDKEGHCEHVEQLGQLPTSRVVHYPGQPFRRICWRLGEQERDCLATTAEYQCCSCRDPPS
jgi:hypothetical protein